VFLTPKKCFALSNKLRVRRYNKIIDRKYAGRSDEHQVQSRSSYVSERQLVL